MSEIRKQAVEQFLYQLAAKYELLEKERLYLVNEAQARVQAIQAEKQELITEAQEQLVKLNELRVALGEGEVTLQQIRNQVQQKPERYTR